MVFYQLTTRAQALAMKAMGATLEQIQNITQIKRRSLQYLIKKALNRGWNPTTNPLILDGYIIDAPRASRKLKVTGRLRAAPSHSTAHRRLHVTLHGPLSPTSYSIIVKNQALFTIVILIQSSVNLNRILPLLFAMSPFSLRRSNGNY